MFLYVLYEGDRAKLLNSLCYNEKLNVNEVFYESEVWSDFVCPFCYIGKRRLEMALEQFPHKKDVEVEFKSFELE